jgi:hypothetical protein
MAGGLSSSPCRPLLRLPECPHKMAVYFFLYRVAKIKFHLLERKISKIS